LDEVIVIGAGPAGTSAALALAEAGQRVRVLDAGTASTRLPPAGDMLGLRFSDRSQWSWQLGDDPAVLDSMGQTSPKLRVPGLRPIFDGYREANRLAADNFQLVGALAVGGLSNAWGCGVAAFDAGELAPLDSREMAGMRDAYAHAAARMGLSGASEDALRDYIGVDEWADPPIPLDALHAHLWRRARRVPTDDLPVRIGRARVAVLAGSRDGREACDLGGMCLWGCTRRATWSAAMDADALRRHPHAVLDTGVLVTRLERVESHWNIECTVAGCGPRIYQARRVLLAAGTIASTALVLRALPSPPDKLALLSNPTAAFLLLLPSALGSGRGRAFGLAQLSFTVQGQTQRDTAFGNLFSTAGLPVSEFLPHLPLSRRAGLVLLRQILPAAIVGNVFMPGHLSRHWMRLQPDGVVRIEGGEAPELDGAMGSVREQLSPRLRKLGAFMLPRSFRRAGPGADLHYAGTLPMRDRPQAHECFTDGQVAGLPGLYAIDGACLPTLPAKAHTLTIMANAFRIARGLLARP
jgi:choline dehydrogenase-like flavoprotein